MSKWNDSRELKSAIEAVCREAIQKETKECFRVYRATVVKGPYTDPTLGDVCQVVLVGDESVLTLPFSKSTSSMRAGDSVLVATISDTFRNAIVWEERFFQNEYVTQKHYGARWNKTLAQMERVFDAETITTDTANFGYFGSVNANYNNPFDNIYPWSEIRLCNIDLDLYLNLQPGESVTNCVKAWEGDADFSYTDEMGVWRYRPEFYGSSWDEGDYRYFDVCRSYSYGYVHYPEAIVGRWFGRNVQKTINGSSKNCLIPSVGMPAKRIALSTLHTYAKNYEIGRAHV